VSAAPKTRAAWAAVLGWCGIAGWFAFLHNTRVPLLWYVDLGFHELGHLVMYVFPINEVLTAAMGSIMQCAVPLGLAAYFWFGRRDRVAACVCAAWAATNLQDASVYIADAPTQRLELIGGEHDWAFVLGPDHLNRLQDAHTIAAVVRGAGLVLLLATVVVAFHGLLHAGATGSSVAGPVEATAATPDDLCPNTSRMPYADPRRPSTRWSSWDHRSAPDRAPRPPAR
jgi:hypothetical protein